MIIRTCSVIDWQELFEARHISEKRKKLYWVLCDARCSSSWDVSSERFKCLEEWRVWVAEHRKSVALMTRVLRCHLHRIRRFSKLWSSWRMICGTQLRATWLWTMHSTLLIWTMENDIIHRLRSTVFLMQSRIDNDHVSEWQYKKRTKS